MQEEVFGPIMPILCVRDMDEGLAIVRNRASKPLALYVFAKDRSVCLYNYTTWFINNYNIHIYILKGY